jgi:hypothetical protein
MLEHNRHCYNVTTRSTHTKKKKKLIGELPLSYDSRPGNAQPGLDGEAWKKVQKAIDGERNHFANRIDTVSQEMAMTRQRQAEIESRMTK